MEKGRCPQSQEEKFFGSDSRDYARKGWDRGHCESDLEVITSLFKSIIRSPPLMIESIMFFRDLIVLMNCSNLGAYFQSKIKFK